MFSNMVAGGQLPAIVMSLPVLVNLFIQVYINSNANDTHKCVSANTRPSSGLLGVQNYRNPFHMGVLIRIENPVPTRM